MRITGTFLDEISHDIPHQNWGPLEWDQDFRAMKAIGIDTVVMIRCSHKLWMTYPSNVLRQENGCYSPSVDLVRLFLDLSEKYGMSFYFGTSDSGLYWGDKNHKQEIQKDVDLCRRVVDEAWDAYGTSPAFRGWYITKEFSRSSMQLVQFIAKLGKHCKDISGNLPTMISPYILGVKTMVEQCINATQHEKEWNEIMAGITGAIDIVAFQDGHVEFNELPEFLTINKKLANYHGLECWTNSETFDRDMPIKFPPIKWEKLLLKLQAAEQAGYDKAITFEFSHFMSPNSAYRQAAGLFDRYSEYYKLSTRASDFGQ